MGREIERKFLVTGNDWRRQAVGMEYRQGYLCADGDRTVRVRIAGEKAFVTIKGKSSGISRMEFEYAIPVEDAKVLLAELCEQPIIEKIRYKIDYQGFVWEVDEFLGDNAGLLVAEIELAEEEQAFEKPPWVGAEVSADRRYSNAGLVRYPFSRWEKK
jgi:adenylate cyclase